MIFLVVADKQDERRPHIDAIMKPLGESEVLIYDDTYGTVLDLEQYLYPSLFSVAPPVVRLKFMLATEAATLTTPFLKQLLASPTIFIFEEMVLPAPVITLFKKAGAIVYGGEKKAAAKKEGDVFAVTKALTAADKKSRWLAFRAALTDSTIDAVMGILYWKVRDLAAKNPKEKDRYNTLYKNLLTAQARAWETGTPLELMIEKVILTQ